uniref:Uncharacterized protein n=1 Tax=Trichinella nativa TaxID=6335 RepID=A0A0V1KJ91_9BILA
MNTVGPGIWREIRKKLENEKCTSDMDYGEESEILRK